MQHIGSYELPSEHQVENVDRDVPRAAVPGLRRARRRPARPAASCATWSALRVRRAACRAPHARSIARSTTSGSRRSARTELECADCTRKADVITDAVHRAGCPRCARRSGSICARPTRAIRRRAASTRSCSRYPGTYAITVYRIAHALLREGARDHPAHDDRARAPPDRHRHPPGRRDRECVLHRPRHRRRDRRDHADRQARADLPGRHARAR